MTDFPEGAVVRVRRSGFPPVEPPEATNIRVVGLPSTVPGPPGADGEPGPPGPPGDKGDPGSIDSVSILHTGEGPPDVVPGAKAGDRYVDTLTGALYRLT